MRTLKLGQIYTSHDGTNLYRVVKYMEHIHTFGQQRPVEHIYYHTNGGPALHVCRRSTFIDWLRIRKARKTQKKRMRKL